MSKTIDKGKPTGAIFNTSGKPLRDGGNAFEQELIAKKKAKKRQDILVWILLAICIGVVIIALI